MSSATDISLTSSERALLTSYEAVIQQGLESFVEVGNALAKIRDARLYRNEFDTFEDYCSRKWSLSRPRAYQFIAAAEVVDDVSTIVDTPKTESQARPLTQVPREQRAEVWQEAVATAPIDERTGEPKITAKHVEQVVAKALDKPTPHVANNSGNNEWYTPPAILEAAREVLGVIDCDPASSEVANQNVKAKRIYTAENCGLAAKKWGSRVWMNPPYAQPLCEQFCGSLVERFKRGEVREAIVLVNNATETAWFQSLAKCASAVCFLSGRVKFLDATNEPRNTPLQGQSVLYFGERFSEFLRVFESLGWSAIVQ